MRLFRRREPIAEAARLTPNEPGPPIPVPDLLDGKEHHIQTVTEGGVTKTYVDGIEQPDGWSIPEA